MLKKYIQILHQLPRFVNTLQKFGAFASKFARVFAIKPQNVNTPSLQPKKDKFDFFTKGRKNACFLGRTLFATVNLAAANFSPDNALFKRVPAFANKLTYWARRGAVQFFLPTAVQN